MSDFKKSSRYALSGATRFIAGAGLLAVSLGLAGMTIYGGYKNYQQANDALKDQKKIENRIKDYCRSKAALNYKEDTPAYTDAYQNCIEQNNSAIAQLIGFSIPLTLALFSGVFSCLSFLSAAAYLQLARGRGKVSYKPVGVPIPDIGDTAEQLSKQGVKISSGFTSSVSVKLPPNGTVIAEAGALAAMDDGIEMQVHVLGRKKSATAAMKQVASGEALSIVRFQNVRAEPAEITLSQTEKHGIITIPLQDGQAVYSRRGGFFAATGDVSISFERVRKISVARFSGIYALQKLSAANSPAIVMLGARGDVRDRVLNSGEMVKIPAGRLVAFAGDVELGTWEQPTAKERLFSGTSKFLTTVTGPGRVWYELPVPREKKPFEGLRKWIDRLTPG